MPRALLIVLTGMLLATLLAVAFLLGREAGRAEPAATDLIVQAQHIFLSDVHYRAVVAIQRIGVGDHRVQIVVAA